MATDAREPEATGPRHAQAPRSVVDRLLHGSRRPLRHVGLRGWFLLIVFEICFVGLAVQDLPHAALAGVGWLMLALGEAGLFLWYVRRPVAK